LLRALLHLLGAFLGDDDVALFRRRGLLIDRFQRLRPGLARRPACAGRIELGAEFERVRQRRIGLAVHRHGLVDVLAGIAIGGEGGFGGRTQGLAFVLVVWKTRRYRRERDREIAAVAGAHADGTVGAGWRAEIGARRCGGVVAAEQIAQKVARTGRRRG